ncbi:CBS domain-containing protein [Streptomyces sp. SAI-135]|uniref:CBS domain-containing protein n=1 Tax=unclassified Streptomyces TaxID=2593676 RepID=UPI0024756A4A|nr:MULTISPECIES: CBS domain-containing protein [unclassified Streptomyces]MDH6521598.1 CBS domain-containing protein [Streptomyces sp. SAI-090]MDH6553891.1 CBS domain-containing protein [Streptomyces sp. SAI-041]MDH6572969.1 CBS domain-containing protein [Streptomyces sp. SAI-117]MDH6582069.1 CBS domain-containing protein [Streptomyces sp. SAI-133]MDH6614302.1 CBS domain-containing protein [Streptomyces sp. SAI-135]
MQHHRTVADLMSHDVVRVRRDTPFKEIVELLADNGITAVPVVDELDHPLGVVSEADLLRKCSTRSDPFSRSPQPHLDTGERARAEGATAVELMSAPALCARPEWTVTEAARLMALHKVKRLPVVDEADRLKGIVSRGDLLRTFLRRDDAIRDEITKDVLQRTLNLAPSDVTAEVHEGVVTLRGAVEASSLIPVIERLCCNVDGVVSVSAHIGYRFDVPGTAPAET